jgi:hypothetical protein
VTNGDKLKKPLITEAKVGQRLFSGKLQNCASCSTLAQFFSGWRCGRGAVGKLLTTKEQRNKV